MAFVTIGRYSLNYQILSELKLSEAYDKFGNIPQNVVKAAWETVNGKSKGKAKK